MGWVVCYLIFKYLRTCFQICFCCWHLNCFHYGQRTPFVWLGSFWIGGRCFMAQNMVHLGKCSRWTCEHSTWCPMNYEVFPSGCWEQEIFPPNVSSSFISSFPSQWVFPWVFSLPSHRESYSAEDSRAKLSGTLSLCSSFFPRSPSPGRVAAFPAQTQSFPSSLSKATLVAASLCGHLA